MNKGKIITSIGAVLLTVGIIGGVYSGVVAMPKVINKAQNADNNLSKAEVLYKEQVNLAKLNISTNVSNVTIKKYDGKNVIVERDGNKHISTISTQINGDELIINEETNKHNPFKNIDDMVRYFVDRLYSSTYSNITVYVPNNLNIDVKTINENLKVDDIKIDTLNFDTSYGNISLSEDSKVNNLNIKSNDYINLKVREVYRTNNLNIECGGVTIYEDSLVKNKSAVPDNISIVINTTNTYNDSESIDIASNLPIAKNLNITSNETVDLNLPVLDYKFNFNIKTLNSISIDEDTSNKYLGTSLNKYIEDGEYELDSNSFEGVLNKNLKDSPSKYFVNIRSGNVIFR